MPVYKAPVDEVTFLLRDVFRLDRYNNLPGFAEATPDVVEAVLAEAAKFSEAVLMPLNRIGDKEGCRRNADGSVGTRNILGIATTVQCVAPTVDYAVRRIKSEVLPHGSIAHSGDAAGLRC